MDDNTRSRDLFASLQILASSTPGASLDLGTSGVGSLTMTTPFALFNGVITTAAAPDIREIDRWAKPFERSSLPWSIQLRGEPTPAVVALAASYGLTDRHLEPLMCASLPTPCPAPDLQPGDIRAAQATRIREDSAALYLAALAEGSGASADALGVLVSPTLLKHPAVAAYLTLVDDEPVATGMTILADDVLGVLNMSTVPAHRRRGYARGVLLEMLAAGAQAGARTAVLQASEAARPLYESVGFQTVETWTYLLAPDADPSDPADR